MNATKVRVVSNPSHGVVLIASGALEPHLDSASQRGQALTEMLLVGGLMVLSWHAFEYLHHMRELAFRANEAARLGAFALAAGAPAARLAEMRATSPVVLEAIDAASPRANAPAASPASRPHLKLSSFVPEARALASDWLSVPAGLIGARARPPLPSVHAAVRGGATYRAGLLSAVGGEVRLASAAPRRHLLLAAHAGHAPGMAQAQERLTQSRSGWRAAADRSIALSRQVAAAGEPVDRPWHARRLNTDWLAPWSDLIRTPGDRGQP